MPFTGCEEDFYICYGENTDGRKNLIEEYAAANGMTALKVVDTTGKGVIVNYPEQPLVLTPDVRRFFYGENADSEHFDTFEYAEDALDYGFEEWNAPKRDEYGCLPDGYKHYTEICIVNGYAKNQRTWEENGRIKRLLMYVEDKPYAYLELEDTIYPQYFLLSPDDIKVAEGDEITFRFVIEDVYPGTLYEDTCLTGLVMEFTGRHGH